MVFAIVGEKGGTGKSTIAHSLASEWKAQGYDVLLVDADPQGTTRLGWLQALESGLERPECIVGSVRIAADLAKHPSFSHVIIDTPGRLGDVQRAALRCADVAIIPTAPTAADVWALKGITQSILEEQARRPSLRAALVAAKLKARTRTAEEARETLKSVGLPVFRQQIFNREAWALSLARGQGVAQCFPSSPAADELRGLVAEITRLSRRPT
jgi:chromosome partitioning protein